MKAIEKIQQVFGDNYVIKSKKVNELAEIELTSYEERERSYGNIHFFRLDAQHKVQGSVQDTYLKATQMKNGKWWIQA